MSTLPLQKNQLMTTDLDLQKLTRQNVLKIIDGLTLERINKIPDGYSGNIAWHIGHIIATQQGLIYGLSGNEMTLEKTFIDRYKKGTIPQAPINQTELDFIKSELAKQPHQLILDNEKNIFQNYTSYTTSFGNTISNFREAVAFNNIHEGMHIGYILAMKHLV